MKNWIIAIFATYIFWTDFAIIHPLPVLPVVAVCFWLIVAEVDEVVTDYRKRIREGHRLQRRIKRLEREVD